MSVAQVASALMAAPVSREAVAPEVPHAGETTEVVVRDQRPAASTEGSEYRDLPLTQLQESPTNPRRRFESAALADLAASIRAQGVLAPLLVRPIGQEQYEVIAGARRFRAAQVVGLDTLPVRVRAMTDAQAQEVQLVENLQRRDIHPLEEAQGFRALLALTEPRYDAALIGAKAGKSESFVYARLKLCDLVPDVAEAFLEDRITTAHALLIARLPEQHQADAYQAAFRDTWTGKGYESRLLPVRELAEWAEHNLLLELHSAVFDTTDATLVPEAGACPDCPKRTGYHPTLLSEVTALGKRDSCLDRSCFQAKRDRHTARLLEARSDLIQISSAYHRQQDGPLPRGAYVELRVKEGKKAKGRPMPLEQPCEHRREAVVMDGGSQGRVVTVCAVPDCAVHGDPSRRTEPINPEERRRWEEQRRAEQRREADERRRVVATKGRLLTEVLQRVPVPLSKTDLEVITGALIQGTPHEHRRALCERHHLDAQGSVLTSTYVTLLAQHAKGLDEAGLCRFLVELAVAGPVLNTLPLPEDCALVATAQRYRVDPQAIERDVASQFAEREKKRQARQAQQAGAKAAVKAKRTPTSGKAAKKAVAR